MIQAVLQAEGVEYESAAYREKLEIRISWMHTEADEQKR